MDDAAISALVEQRVSEELARRDRQSPNGQAAINAQQEKDKQEKDFALRQYASAAADESEGRLKTDRFRLSGAISRSPDTQAIAAALVEEIEAGG